MFSNFVRPLPIGSTSPSPCAWSRNIPVTYRLMPQPPERDVSRMGFFEVPA